MTYWEIVKAQDDEKRKLNIANAHQLYLEMKHEKEKYNKLEQLAFEDYVSTVKRNVDYTPLLFCVPGARDYVNGEKKQRTNYKYLIEYIKDNITGIDIKVDKFAQYGMESYAIGIYFKYNKDYFELVVPDMRNVNTKNFDVAHQGMIDIMIKDKDNESCWNCIKASYDLNEIKKAFEEYVNRQEEQINELVKGYCSMYDY